MNFQRLLTTVEEYKLEDISLETLTTLLNDTFGDWLASQGVSSLTMFGDNTVCLNVRGELKHTTSVKGIKTHSRFLVISLAQVADNPEAIADALKGYSSEGDGAYVWVIPDGYMAALTPVEQEWEEHGGGYFSHESICISNTADIDTRCLLEVLYEDTTLENVSCEFDVPAHRSVHYRLDKLKNENGELPKMPLLATRSRVVMPGSLSKGRVS